MEAFMHRVWFGNSLQAYLFAASYWVVGWITVWGIGLIVRGRLTRWAKNTSNSLDDLIIRLVDLTVIPLLYVTVTLAAFKSLALPTVLSKTLGMLWACVVMVSVVQVALKIIRHLLFDVWTKKQRESAEMERHLRAFMPIISIVVWGLGVVLLLDNLGFKITAIVAGLGITGVAVALAAQAVLGDLFGYFAITFDRPFEIDDFIVIGDMMGAVEHIGIKTTRIRSLSGEQLIFSNKDLTDSRVRNFKRMNTRRVEYKLGVTYETPSKMLKRAVAIVRESIESKKPDTVVDRVHWATYGDWSLGIEAIYFVRSADYNKYMDIQQDINFLIKDAFEREGIEFAFPSQTVYQASEKPAFRTRPEPLQGAS